MLPLPPLVGRLLGFKATSPKLQEIIDKAISSMLEEAVVVLRDEKLFLA